MNVGIMGLGNQFATLPRQLLGSPTPVPTISNKTSFSPLSLPDLTAWFDAADDSTFTLTGSSTNLVSEWRDKSENRYSVVQPIGNSQPVRELLPEGQRAINFDGVDDYLGADNVGIGLVASGKQPLTLVTVGRAHDPAENTINALGTWCAWGNSANATPFIYHRTNGSSGVYQLALRSDAGSTSGGYFSGGPTGQTALANNLPDRFIVSVRLPPSGTTTAIVHSAMFASGGGVARPLYGVKYNTASRPDEPYTLNRFSVGALWRTTASDFFPGRICEIVIYRRILSDSETADLALWLGAKHNLSIPIPS